MANGEPEAQRQSQDQPAIRQADIVSSERREMLVSWEGPLPPPQTLEGYERVIPGAANGILELVERQSEHRMQMEKALISGDSRRSYLGLIAGFLLSGVVIGGGIYLVATDHDWAGASMIGVSLVGLASVFVYGSRGRRDDQQREPDSADRDQ